MKNILFITFIWFGAESMVHSALVVSDGQLYRLTFEEDVADVFLANVGKETTYYPLSEPGSYARGKDLNRGNTLFSESVAIRYTFANGDGGGVGRATRFLSDGNQDGDVADNCVGYNQMGVRLGAGVEGNHACRISTDLAGGDSGLNGLYLRIQNLTGVTVTDWIFSADIFFGEQNNIKFSELQFSYATDNGTDPNAMSFTSFGSAPVVTAGAVITTLAGSMKETVKTSGVEHGGYIVLQFSDVAQKHGSAIWIDNVGVKALVRWVVPEPVRLE